MISLMLSIKGIPFADEAIKNTGVSWGAGEIGSDREALWQGGGSE